MRICSGDQSYLFLSDLPVLNLKMAFVLRTKTSSSKDLEQDGEDLSSPGSCGCENSNLVEGLNGEGGMAAIDQKKQAKRLRDLNGRGYLQ